MTADISRDRRPNALARGYSGLVMQQGRLSTDSDWNEAFAIARHRQEAGHATTFGPSGTSKPAPGFAISASAGGFTIAAGTYWVNGQPVNNPAALTHDAQPGQAAFPAGIANGAEVLIALETWNDTITPLDDPRIAEPALGGVDTAWREVTRWRVRARQVTLSASQRAQLTKESRCGMLLAPDIAANAQGRMRATTALPGTVTTDDCMIPPDSGYVSQENQTYRVQIFQGGNRASARVVFSRENGSVIASLRQNAGQFTLGDMRQDDGLGFATGDIVELFDDRLRAQAQPGTLHRLTLTGGVATFDPALPGFAALVNPRLRRWDQRPAGNALSLDMASGRVRLERGLEVEFTDATYAAGQYWIFEARAATGQPVWPPVAGGQTSVPPMGGNRTSAALALATVAGTGLSQLIDLRAIVPTLSCLTAADIRFDATNCAFQAETVQQAIEALCQRGSGLCSVTVRTEAELRAAVAAMGPGESIRICLTGHPIPLAATVRIAGLGHVTLSGAGPQSKLTIAGGEMAVQVVDCASFDAHDLTIIADGFGTSGRFEHRSGGLAAQGCARVRYERVAVTVGHGLDRNACGLSTTSCAEVTVRDCRLTVGQMQIGLQVTGSERAVIEDNHITVLTDTAPTIPLTDDPVIIGRLSRGLMWFSQRNYRSVTPDGDEEDFVLGDRRGRSDTVQVSTRQSSVAMTALFGIAETLAAVFAENDSERGIGANRMRQVLRDYLNRALRNNGRLDVGRQTWTVFEPRDLDLATAPMMAQGIVVAGATIEDVQIRGNRIFAAQEGIRIGASSRGDKEVDWTAGTPPPNLIKRAIVADNRIHIRPVSAVTNAFGIYLGHADRVNCDRNEVTAPVTRSKFLATRPHFGLHQYGWRGPLLSWQANVVEHCGRGYLVAPDLSVDGRRWVLRDNAAEACDEDRLLARGVFWNPIGT